jgi:hypothetical protein
MKGASYNGIFFDGRQGGGGGDPYLKWATKNVPGFIIKGGGYPPVHAQMGVALFVFDYPTTAAAWVTYDPKFHVVAWPYRTPPMPKPGSAYKPAVVFKTLVLGHTGILGWVADAEYPMTRMGNYFEQYEDYPEAIAGKLPVYRYIGNDPHKLPAYPNDTFNAPCLEIIDWMERDKDIFGEPTVPPPAPTLPESETPVALPASLPSVANAAATEPFRPVPVVQPTSTSTPPAAPATPATPAAHDLLARYVRKS